MKNALALNRERGGKALLGEERKYAQVRGSHAVQDILGIFGENYEQSRCC